MTPRVSTCNTQCSAPQIAAVVALPVAAYLFAKIILNRFGSTGSGLLGNREWTPIVAAGLTAAGTLASVAGWNARHQGATAPAPTQTTATSTQSSTPAAPPPIASETPRSPTPVPTTPAPPVPSQTASPEVSPPDQAEDSFEAVLDSLRLHRPEFYEAPCYVDFVGSGTTKGQAGKVRGVAKPNSTTTPEQANEKMWRNLRKAFAGHYLDLARKVHLKPSLERYMEGVKAKYEVTYALMKRVEEGGNPPIRLGRHSVASKQGEIRTAHEDAHCAIEIPEVGQFYGVFDGHGDHGAVARQLAKELPERIAEHVREGCNPYDAFNRAFYDMEHELECSYWTSEGEARPGGSTAVICFIPKGASYVCTGTLGDSEAKILRGVGETLFAYPLSKVWNWADPCEEHRFVRSWVNYCQRPELFDGEKKAEICGALRTWLNQSAKHRRSGLTEGVNVSRSFADLRERTMPSQTFAARDQLNDRNMQIDRTGFEVLSGKPGVTVSPIMPGDKILICCDGFWDFVIDQEVGEQLQKGANAENLVDWVLNEKRSTDNATVMIVPVEAVRPARHRRARGSRRSNYQR